MAVSRTFEQVAAQSASEGRVTTDTVRRTSSALADASAPLTVSVSPADNATGVAVNASLVINFNEAVRAGSGSILIHNADGTVARAIAVTDTSQVIFSSNAVIINPTLDLSAGRGYYVNFAAGVFQDMSGNAHAGMSGSSAYNFTTASPVAGDDFPFSADTTGVVVVGAAGATGTLETGDDVDLMKITLVAGTKYTFSLSSSASGGLADPYLSLYGPDLALIKFDDDSGGGTNSKISFTASTSGVHYLGATDFTSGTGSYVMSAALSTDAADDYAESTQTTGVLAIGGFTSGAINFSADRDWVKVSLVAGVNYVFQLGGADSGAGSLGVNFAEAYLQLLDASGNVLRAAADGGAGGDPRLSYTAPGSGSYYLAVSDLYDAGTGSYTLSAVLGLDDFGDDANTLGSVAMGGTRSGTLDVGNDDDWFAVTLTQGHSYRFELSTANSGGGTLGAGDAEGYLKLFDAASALIDQAFEGANGLDPVLLFTASRSGLHYLSVSELLGLGTGSYTLKATSLTVVDDFAASVATTGVVAVGGQATGAIEQAGDADWFAVDLVAGASYVFDLKGSDGGGGTLGAGAAEAYLVLHGPTGLYQQAAVNGGDGGDPRIAFTAAASGRYFLSASDVFGASTGSYTIKAALGATPDTTAPALFSASPADEATGVLLGANITLGFNEAVVRGSGTIVLRKADGTLVESFDAASSPLLSFSGTTLTINPSANYAYNTAYKLELAAGNVRDAAGNGYAGLTTYNFTTEQQVNTRPTGAVAISGLPTQGLPLTALSTLADVDGLGTLKYQWLADGVAINGATGYQLTLAQVHVGKKISVNVSYIDGQGNPEAATSVQTAAVANVNDVPTGALSIVGVFTQGQILAASNPTLLDPDGLGSLAYRWLANGVAIEGATESHFTLTQAQVGKAITVEQSYTDNYGAREKFTSAASAAVANLNDAGQVLVSTTIYPGMLTAVVNDADGLTPVSYQWQSSSDGSSWTNVPAAADVIFIPQGAYLHTQLRVVASYTDAFGTAEKLTSAPTGSLSGERLFGTGGADTIEAGGGNDSITGGAGDDIINGGAGIDTAVFSGAASRYTITRTKTGVAVADNSGSDGIDSLSGIERLLFGSEGYALDTSVDGIGGQAYRLYQAAFDRAPDARGVGFWMSAMDKGSTLVEVAAGFVASPEYQALYPATLGNLELVTRYYVNILGRAPEQAGLDFWTDVLDQKLSSVPEVLAAISESNENVSLTAVVIGSGFPYTPYM